MNKSTPFSNNKIYESERLNIELNQSDFAQEDEFGERNTAIDELQDYLFQQNYVRFVYEKESTDKTKIENTMQIDILNKIFYNVYNKFSHKISLIDYFSTFCDCFGFDGQYLYWNLAKIYRIELLEELKTRINLDSYDTGERDKNQSTFGLKIIRE